MPGSYGNMLAAFPELMADYEVFKMEPLSGGGYGKRHDKRTVTGYWSWRKRAEMSLQGDLNTANEQATFWAEGDFLTGKCLIGQGDYVEVDGRVFKVIEDDNFSREGAFTRCTMQLVSGLDGRQVTNPQIGQNVRTDY
jgi:hypothetical protein